MVRKDYKGRCKKWRLEKCADVMRAYSEIQAVYAEKLQADDSIKEIHCNVLLENLEDVPYTTDFLCVKADGELMVRECVARKLLTKPKTVKLLDISRTYWTRRGVTDWGLVTDAEG